jgi:RNA polymerase sigma factor (sigma-70 family)
VADTTIRSFVRRVRANLAPTSTAARTDGELLARFADARDEEAFAELVGRHGPLVRNVCGNIMRNEQDTEETAQAAFLVLARRAGTLRDVASLAGWLHGVAYRTAIRARRDAARRRARESRARPAATVPPAAPPAEASWRELQELLDRELQRLPEKLRAPFVLCCLERVGKVEAARLLGRTPGTVSGQLDRARKLLRVRLARRAVSLSAVLCGLAVAGDARAGPSSAFVAETVAASVRFVGAGTAFEDSAARMAATVLRGTFVGRARAAAFVLFALVALSGGIAASVLGPATPAAAPESVALAPLAPVERPAPPHSDRFGDALPDAATARLGTKRFVHSYFTDSIVWSPDGKVLASLGGYSLGRRLCLWDAATGRELYDLPAEGSVVAAAFSPDGKTLAATEKRGVILWDVASGKEAGQFNFEPSAWAVAFSPDGKTLAVPDKESVIHLWDVASGFEVSAIVGPGKRLTGLTFSPDGGTIAAATNEGVVGLWRLDGAKELWRRVLPDGKPNGVALAFAPGGKELATVSSDLVVRVLDVRGGGELRVFDGGDKSRRPAVVYSPDGKVLASAGKGSAVILWDPETGHEIRRWLAGPWQVYSLRFAPDGRTLASCGGWGSTIRLWDPATGAERNPLPGHRAIVDALFFAADGKTLWSLGRDKALIRWDLATGDGKLRFGGPLNGLVDRMAVTADGRTLVTGSRVDGVVRLWDNAGNELATLGRHDGEVAGVAFSADGKLLASSGKDGVLRLWDVAMRKEVRHFDVPKDLGGSLAFSPDSRRLALGGLGIGPPGMNQPRVLDLSTGDELFRFGTSRPAVCAVYSPDGRFLATAGELGNQGVRLWDAETGKELGRLGSQEGVSTSLAFSPDNRFLATGGGERDSTLRVWELATRQEVACFLGHHSAVNAVAFSRDGRTLASGGGDATVFLWDLAGRATTGRDRPETLPPARLGECWADLLAADAAKAHRALRTLAADPARAVPFLAKHLQPAPPADPALLARLAAALDAETFGERERAEAELGEWRFAAEMTLNKLREGSGPAEGKRRAGVLLDRLGVERVRMRRALAALEYCGTPGAREALRSLTKGMVDASLADEARSCLVRLQGLLSLQP